MQAVGGKTSRSRRIINSGGKVLLAGIPEAEEGQAVRRWFRGARGGNAQYKAIVFRRKLSAQTGECPVVKLISCGV